MMMMISKIHKGINIYGFFLGDITNSLKEIPQNKFTPGKRVGPDLSIVMCGGSPITLASTTKCHNGIGYRKQQQGPGLPSD